MSARPRETQLWDIFRGAMTTRALAIAADLGIAEALADGPRPVDELAREVGANGDTLHRLLRALASDGVFAEVEAGVFENTPPSELLREGTPMRAFAHFFGGPWYRAVGELTGETGAATFPAVFDSDFWAWLAEHPEERAAFDHAMESGKEQRVERLAGVEWRDGETVVDVGGGNGSLLVELLRRHPELRGIVFDLSETDRDEAALGERIEFVAGSFFEGVPLGDAYVLGTVLHDWDDEHAGSILRVIRTTAPPHARLLILDAVVPPGNEPHGSKWLDLLMLTLFGGRERTESEWRALLAGTGFGIDSIEAGLIQASCR